MKKYLSLILLPLFLSPLFSQNGESGLPEFQLKKETFETHLRYIASDKMQGRYTGSEGGELTADYIAILFQIYGLQPVTDRDNLYQKIPFQKINPPKTATLKLGATVYEHGDDLVVMRGKATEFEAEAIFAGHGWVDEENGHDDFEGLDVKDKVLFVLPGVPGNQNPFKMFSAMSIKRKLAIERGAVGVVELFRMQFPWRFFKSYFNKERLELDESDDRGFFYAFLKEDKPNPVADLEQGGQLPVIIRNSGIKSKGVNASNVVGVIEGSDEKLKEEYVIVSAHYDHVGVGKQGGGAVTPQDSIFNGARDNGMGTVALLAAAKALGQHPPKRSVIFLACTGEEIGMVGSAYYTAHPLIDLDKTVFNLNNDGGGYNTTEQFSVIGFSKTNVQQELEKAASATGLTISKDPAPEQGLYTRSDNISFAVKGIPAIDFAPGVTDMDEEIMKYYHQVADNPESIDYDYLLKFCQAFAHAARLIADKEDAPAWTPGDEYEKIRD